MSRMKRTRRRMRKRRMRRRGKRMYDVGTVLMGVDVS